MGRDPGCGLARAHCRTVQHPRGNHPRSAGLVAATPGAPRPGAEAWRNFCRKLAQRGVERAAHEGPRDYTTRAARSVPDARRSILRIGELYIRLRYGAQQGAAHVARLQRLVRALRVT